jgi:hypothetical protein
MSSLYRQFKLDDTKLAEGVAVVVGKNDDDSDITFIVGRIAPSNLKYSKMFEQETRPYRRQIDNETLDDMISREIFLKVFCRTILLGWKNVQNEKNETLPFNYENAMALMKKLPELYDDLQAQAKKASLFREEMQETAAKN